MKLWLFESLRHYLNSELLGIKTGSELDNLACRLEIKILALDFFLFHFLGLFLVFCFVFIGK